MKVLLATTQFWPDTGGVPRLLWTVFSNRPQQVELRVLSVQNVNAVGNGEPAEPVEWVIPNRIPRLTSLTFLIRLWQLTRDWKPDWILCGVGFPTAILAAVVHRLSGVPVAVYTHSEDLTIRSSFHRRLLGWAFNQASVIYALTEFGRGHLASLGVAGPLIHILPPGIDPRRFVERAAQPGPGQAGSFTLLTVARLVRRKGQDTVIRALPELLRAIPTIRYIIIGSGPDEQYLRDLAQSEGVAEQVVFAGAVADDLLPAYYQTCDVFVMPSRISDDGSEVEGFGIAYLEAAAAARPAIGGRSGGVADAIQEGVSGFLIDPLDAQELARRVKELAANPSLAQEMGNAGQARVLSQFTALEFSRRLFALLEKPSPLSAKDAG